MRVSSLVAAFLLLAGCKGGESESPPSVADAGAGAEVVQQTADAGAGAEQATPIQNFEARLDGGRIEMQHFADDAEAIAGIRSHLQEMLAKFQAADFSTPDVTDPRAIPGAVLMTEKHDAITYTYVELPRGGEIYITSEDPYTIDPIHAFIAFQREAHAGGAHAHH